MIWGQDRLSWRRYGGGGEIAERWGLGWGRDIG